MRRIWLKVRWVWLAVVIAGLLAGEATFAAELRDLPLRVHVYSTRSRQTLQAGRPLVIVGGGRANLYEHGQPVGMNFRFKCEGRLPTSEGYGTYPARWKERQKVLEVFIPDADGKQGHRCLLDVQPQAFAYYRRAGVVETEPVAAFKAWMDKHSYDPEKGKNVPVG